MTRWLALGLALCLWGAAACGKYGPPQRAAGPRPTATSAAAGPECEDTEHEHEHEESP